MANPFEEKLQSKTTLPPLKEQKTPQYLPTFEQFSQSLPQLDQNQIMNMIRSNPTGAQAYASQMGTTDWTAIANALQQQMAQQQYQQMMQQQAAQQASPPQQQVPPPQQQIPQQQVPQQQVPPPQAPQPAPQPAPSQQPSQQPSPQVPQPAPQPVPEEGPPPTYADPSSSINIDSLLEKLASFSLDDSYLNKMKGNLRQDVMNSAAAQREELANRLASAGIEGGMALDTLSDVDRAVASGMASGLSDLYQNFMNRRYDDLMGITDRQIQRENLDRNFGLGVTDREIQLESLKQQFGLRTREDQMQFAQFLIQASMYADQEESKRMLEIANALLYGDAAGGV